jgi:predicted metal-dependent hydrolase
MQPDQIIRTNRKSIAILVDQDGQVIVRAPKWATDDQIHSFVTQKTNWIFEQQDTARRWRELNAPKQFLPGETFWYLGQAYPLELVGRSQPKLTLNGNFQLSKGALSEARQVFTEWYREQTRSVVGDRVRLYAEEMDLRYKKLRITSAQTRWGSCSSLGNLNFPWRLVMTPLEAIDYVVVHELAHLRHPNHSKVFWVLVASILPDYMARRKWLRENGQVFHL